MNKGADPSDLNWALAAKWVKRKTLLGVLHMSPPPVGSSRRAPAERCTASSPNPAPALVRLAASHGHNGNDQRVETAQDVEHHTQRREQPSHRHNRPKRHDDDRHESTGLRDRREVAIANRPAHMHMKEQTPDEQQNHEVGTDTQWPQEEIKKSGWRRPPHEVVR